MSVESDGTGGVIRAGVGQTLCVTVVNVSFAERQDIAGVRAGGERRGGGWREWSWAGSEGKGCGGVGNLLVMEFGPLESSRHCPASWARRTNNRCPL